MLLVFELLRRFAPALVTLALAAVLSGGGAWLGYRWRDGLAAKDAAARAEAMVQAKQADIERAQAVASAYQTVADLIRRAAIKSQIEVRHEVERIEYRCPLPDSGRVLLDQAIDRANDAAAGRAGGAMP